MKYWLKVVAVTFICLLALSTQNFAQDRMKAPDFNGAEEWLNVERPLSIGDLKGKVVLLDFWTFCCINCIHVIPDLKRLEEKYGNKLAVIGVHSAKFENEKDSNNIRQAILRYEIEHPVVNDAQFAIWQAYGANAWPTMMLIDPLGNLVGRTSGEGNYDLLDQAIGNELKKHQAHLNPSPLPLSLEKNKVHLPLLSFPGKVLVDATTERIFISDSNHNRILVSDLSGSVKTVIGSGEQGTKDGKFDEATFNRPQGLALKGDVLYVADTENHLIRSVNLTQKTVTTLAGTGSQSHDRYGGKAGRDQGLNSPWDLWIHEGYLYIAMAGPHQIWRANLSLTPPPVEVFAGSGREDIIDGAATRAALAQPSGLTSDGKNLYFADSEVSAVRFVTLYDNPQVKTLIGHGLFDFGDKEGAFGNSLLQHPLGVSFGDGALYVADTYNHKIKKMDLLKGTVSTVTGSGKAGYKDGKFSEALFSEPGGLMFAPGKIYVADTNNHAIRVLDLAKQEVSTLKVELPQTKVKTATSSFLPNLTEKKLDPVTISPTNTLNCTLNIKLPEGQHLNAEAPSRFEVRFQDKEKSMRPEIPKSSITLDGLSDKQAGDLICETTLYYCPDSVTGVCKIKSFRFVQPLTFSNEGGKVSQFSFIAEIQ